LGNLIDLSRHAGWQLAAQVEWNVENDQVCNKLPTSFQLGYSFQLVRLVGCCLIYASHAWKFETNLLLLKIGLHALFMNGIRQQ